jgi:hypothetical protein
MEGGREGGTDGRREGGREGGREGVSEGGREGGRERERERERERTWCCSSASSRSRSSICTWKGISVNVSSEYLPLFLLMPYGFLDMDKRSSLSFLDMGRRNGVDFRALVRIIVSVSSQ